MKFWTGFTLACKIILRPTYRILLCDDSNYPGTNWTDTFEVQIDDVRRVIRLRGVCT